MTAELIYDIEDCCPADYAVMSVLSIKGKPTVYMKVGA